MQQKQNSGVAEPELGLRDEAPCPAERVRRGVLDRLWGSRGASPPREARREIFNFLSVEAWNFDFSASRRMTRASLARI